MHWGVVCLDGGRTASGYPRAKMEAETGPGTPRRTRAADHAASQIRHEDAGRTTQSPHASTIELLLRKIHFSDVLRNLSRFGPRQIRQRYHGQLIVDVAVDRGFESLPRAVMMNTSMAASLVDEPAESVVAFV